MFSSFVPVLSRVENKNLWPAEAARLLIAEEINLNTHLIGEEKCYQLCEGEENEI